MSDRDLAEVSAEESSAGIGSMRLSGAAPTLDALLAATPVGLAVLDVDLRFSVLNPPFAAFLGRLTADALGRRPSGLGCEIGVEVERLARQVLGDGRVHQDVALSRADASGCRHWKLSGHPVEVGGGVCGVVIVADEVTDRRRLAELASTDALTGLANHRAFYDRLRSEVERATRHGRALALALIDLDGFKGINDNFGHQAGDRLLVDVAARLAETVRSSDLLARVGGDEFAIVMPETDVVAARALAERALTQVSNAVGGHRQRITVSIGVSGLDEAADADELFRAADRSLYAAKAEGRDRVRGQTPDTYLLSLERDDRVARAQVAAGVRALARAVDLKDVATREHSERVAEMACRLAEVLEWPAERIALLREAALVHDVGKIGVPDVILCKPSSLSFEEYELVKTHAEFGAHIADEILSDEQTGWVRGHHERHDGAGYPDGLAGEAIPDGARILAVADAWDAMTTDRSYQSERSPREAFEECRRCAGTQFAPEVIAAFDTPTFVRYARIFTNQRIARAANDEQRHAAQTGARDDLLQLQCECFMADCRANVAAGRHELETVRGHQRRFFVLAGHEMPDAERVVLRTERFLVVEKRM